MIKYFKIATEIQQKQTISHIFSVSLRKARSEG